MKKNKKTVIVASVAAVAAVLGITVAAAYDSSEDPLISLSYLTNIFKKEVIDEVDQRLDEQNKDIEELVMYYMDQYMSETDNETTPPEQTSPTASVIYEVVELKKGDALYAVTPCDIMLRAGSATVIAPDPTQGISDYTDGEELYHNFGLIKDNMCLIPRGDGRGVLATSESVFLMVRGDFTVVKK